MRNLAARTPAAGSATLGYSTSSTERSSTQRRGSAPATRPEPSCLEDDCAEYADRFIPGYDKGRLLGKGACAVVWLAVPTGGKKAVAIKQVIKGTSGKKRADTESARKEIFFGSYMFHTGGEPKLPPARYPGIRHITKLIDYVETKRDIWLVMEYGGTSLTKVAYEIKGEFLRGERLYRVNHLPTLQEMKRNPIQLQRMLRQLLSALSVLADNRIVHSDIKPDNILVEENESHQLNFRLIDLGSAFTFDSPESLALATPEYMPPEALETCAARPGGSVSSRSVLGRSSGLGLGSRKPANPLVKLHQQSHPWSFDVWSLGSIWLELCLGTPLWLSYKCRVADDQRPTSAALGLFAVPGRDPEKIITRQADALRNRGLQAVLRNAPGVSPGPGFDLLALMLAWEPIDRISPMDALEHPWLHAAPL